MTIVENIDYSDIVTRCGDPGENLVKRPFPFTLYLGGDRLQPCSNFYGHRRIADAVTEVFDDILDYFGIEAIRENGLDNYGGCYNLRPARSMTRMSVHAWGMAVDYLPQLAPLGKPSLIPSPVVDIFRAHGFLSGEYWARRDGMHFTAVREDQ